MSKKPRGMGRVYRPRWTDKSGTRHHSPIWRISYSHRGKPYDESANSTKEANAWKLLKKRHGELAAEKPTGPDVERTTFEDLAKMIVADYETNGRRSLRKCKNSVAHLRDFFAEYKAVEITSDRITVYIGLRQAEKAKSSTINHELAALGRMFTLAIRAGRAAIKPYIAKLQMNNARKGFFERAQFDAVVRHLPEDLRPPVITAYETGWRIHDEILTRQKKHLDLHAGWLRLEPGETKNGEGRMFPLTPDLRDALTQQLAKTEALQLATGSIIPWLFHRDGKPIRMFRRSWVTACKLAGCPGKIPHDFRRTAVRNLERAGVHRSAAMKLVGHKTQSIYFRYAIVEESDLVAAAVKLAALHAKDRKEKVGD